MQLVPSTVENSRKDLYPGSVGIGMDSKLSRGPLYRNWIDSLEASIKRGEIENNTEQREVYVCEPSYADKQIVLCD